MSRSQYLRSLVPSSSHIYASLPGRRLLSSAPEARNRKRALDIDTIVSVLEVSTTKREAKGYLQTYTNRPRALTETPRFEQGKLLSSQQQQQQHEGGEAAVTNAQDPLHVAIVKLRNPQDLDHVILHGVARTLYQLRTLGLLSIVVLDCGAEASRELSVSQALGLSEALDSLSKPSSKFLESIAVTTARGGGVAHADASFAAANGYQIKDNGQLLKAISHGLIPVLPALARQDDTSVAKGADANQLVLALTRYVSGIQFDDMSIDWDHNIGSRQPTRPRKMATVERIIILDPLGGTLMPGEKGLPLRFVNLEQEYDGLVRQLTASTGALEDSVEHAESPFMTHALNLSLAKDALSLLPPSSSTLITSPSAAANTAQPTTSALADSLEDSEPKFGFNGMVNTRRRKNPLLHNLLTDKPVHSSSLPSQRVVDEAREIRESSSLTAPATLVKRGMPLTIFPNPHAAPWAPPLPGASRLRLTDNCIDLPRLVYLIEDSFGRRLDVQDYLARVNDKLAGVIIAGEYEGGAILTWEVPDYLDAQDTQQDPGRLVPYLDKFAVLRSRQGSGGVADIVFNAMVGECFPQGVCWRSRKDNPVNKWYFERSAGTHKLPETNWSMFWTTPGLDNNSQRLRDYENICRQVEPSWLDTPPRKSKP